MEELSLSFEYGLNAAAKEYDGRNKYIRITDIDDDSHLFKLENVTTPDTDLTKAENYKLSEGDILFARTGASVGKTYIYRDSDGLVYYAGFLIRAKIKEQFNPEFVFQNTLTNEYAKFIMLTSMRSGQPGVNAQEYSQFKMMVPSKPEQDKIAGFFRNIDDLITLHQRKSNHIRTEGSLLGDVYVRNSEVCRILYSTILFAKPFRSNVARAGLCAKLGIRLNSFAGSILYNRIVVSSGRRCGGWMYIV